MTNFEKKLLNFNQKYNQIYINTSLEEILLFIEDLCPLEKRIPFLENLYKDSGEFLVSAITENDKHIYVEQLEQLLVLIFNADITLTYIIGENKKEQKKMIFSSFLFVIMNNLKENKSKKNNEIYRNFYKKLLKKYKKYILK
jgi:hypothetical protein